MARLLAKPGIVIRAATIDDVANIHSGLLGIAQTIGDPSKVKSTPDDLRRHGFGERPAFAVLIAEIDSEFAGMCLYFSIFSSWTGRPGVYVQDLFVDERFRGMKIGERLLRHLVRSVQRQGGGYLELAVDTGNSGAQRFYERIGIVHQADDQVHRIVGEAFFAFAENNDFEETP